MKTATTLLVATAPAWFEITSTTPNELIGLARPPKSSWARAGIPLRLFGSPVPAVCEEKLGAHLPAFCPERHINGDGTFCLSLPPPEVREVLGAEQWWDKLGLFLRCQTVAMRTQIWPPGYALDHGDAGHHHKLAEELAATAGLAEEYQSARLGEPSWITDPKIRLHGPEGDPINGRAPCPRGCRKKARGRMIDMVRADCIHRKEVAGIKFHEIKRREKLEKFWKDLTAKGARCCGSMPNCPLKQNGVLQ